MYRGSIPIHRQVDTRTLCKHLAEALEAVRAKRVQVSSNRVTFRGGMLRPVNGRNVLVPFTSGELTVKAGGRRLEYRVTFTGLIVFLVAVSLFLSVFVAAGGASISYILGVVALVWVWIGGANVAIGLIRFRRFLHNAIANCPEGVAQV